MRGWEGSPLGEGPNPASAQAPCGLQKSVFLLSVLTALTASTENFFFFFFFFFYTPLPLFKISLLIPTTAPGGLAQISAAAEAALIISPWVGTSISARNDFALIRADLR